MKLVVFDFDGTIADTRDELTAVSNDVLVEMGYQPMNEQQIQAIRDASPMEALKIAGFPRRKLPQAVRRVRQLMYERYDDTSIYPGLDQQLNKLHKKMQLAILTSNSPENVARFLKRHSIENHFAFTVSKSSLFGKGRHLRTLIARQNLSAKEMVYVGDEVRDVEAAQKAKVHSVAVSWGANSHAALERAHPEAIVDDVNKLAKTILAL